MALRGSLRGGGVGGPPPLSALTLLSLSLPPPRGEEGGRTERRNRKTREAEPQRRRDKREGRGEKRTLGTGEPWGHRNSNAKDTLWPLNKYAATEEEGEDLVLFRSLAFFSPSRICDSEGCVSYDVPISDYLRVLAVICLHLSLLEFYFFAISLSLLQKNVMPPPTSAVAPTKETKWAAEEAKWSCAAADDDDTSNDWRRRRIGRRHSSSLGHQSRIFFVLAALLSSSSLLVSQPAQSRERL